VNRRRGPGTTFAIAGALRQNTTVAVIAQAYDAAGSRWWQLDDFTWVSAPLVIANGRCEAVPLRTNN
nr:hypothetical protein [Anaerolineae bacterium]